METTEDARFKKNTWTGLSWNPFLHTVCSSNDVVSAKDENRLPSDAAAACGTTKAKVAKEHVQ